MRAILIAMQFWTGWINLGRNCLKAGNKSTSATNTNFVSTSVNPLLNPPNTDGPLVTADLPLLYKESNDTAFNMYFSRDRGGIYHLPDKF